MTSRASLRLRTTVLVGALVALALTAAGTVGVLTLDAYLTGRTDDQLRAARDTVAAALDQRAEPVLRERLLRELLAGGVRDGVVHLLHDGAVVASVASDGIAAVPEPAGLAALGAEPNPLGPDLRAVRLATPGLAVALDDGTQAAVDAVVLAKDVTTDRATVARTVTASLVTGLAVAASTFGLVWWAVGRGLAPLRRMATRAQQVADGDRDARLTPIGTVAETTALARAVDDALDRRDAAEARVRDFVADAAHELRTPLTSVHGWADLYLQGGLDPAGVEQAMVRIEAEATRMRTLVEQMSLLARIDADLPLAGDPVDLADVVHDVLADLDVLAPDRPVTWSPGPVVVVGDRDRLRQVVANLVGNVVRHTPAGTPLAVTLGLADGHAVLSVHDAGPGMAPELAERALERFAAGERGGSGLGLAIVAGLVRAHGGTVALDSAPGRGTTVTVHLPLAGSA